MLQNILRTYADWFEPLRASFMTIFLFFADDSADVGEEDSFLGQTTASPNPPQTFNYFSQVPSSSDPFGSIGQPPLTTVAPPAGAPAFSRPPTSLPLGSGPQDGQNAFSPHVPKSQASYGTPPTSQGGMAAYQTPQQSCPPPNVSALPHGASPQGYNPYRHTTLSSRANPYLTPPQLQQSPPPGQAAHPPSSVPPVQMYQTPPGALAQVRDLFLTQWYQNVTISDAFLSELYLKDSSNPLHSPKRKKKQQRTTTKKRPEKS